MTLKRDLKIPLIREKRPFGKNIETSAHCNIISLTELIEPNIRKGGDEEFLKSIYECHPECQRFEVFS